MSVRIIVDSACDMSGKESEYLKIVPLPVTFGTEQYLDGINLSHQEFYEKLITSETLPKTSQVPPHDFEAAIKETLGNGDTPIVITVSSQLSGTYNSARVAASEFDEKVYLVDSENICIGQKVLVQHALRMAQENVEAEEIVSKLEKDKKKIHLFAVLDTLKYLRKSGRISHIRGFVGDVLSIKPIVAIINGKIELVGKSRGSHNANKLLGQLIEKVGGIDYKMPFALGYTGLDDHKLRTYIADSADDLKQKIVESVIGTIGGPIGTHTGPDAFGVAFFHTEV